MLILSGVQGSVQERVYFLQASKLMSDFFRNALHKQLQIYNLCELVCRTSKDKSVAETIEFLT